MRGEIARVNKPGRPGVVLLRSHPNAGTDSEAGTWPWRRFDVRDWAGEAGRNHGAALILCTKSNLMDVVHCEDP